MAEDASRTLFHPFLTEDVALPGAGERVVFYGARPGLALPDGFDGELTLVQGFRPDFLALAKQGFSVVPEIEGDGLDFALVLGGRHRGLTDMQVQDALARLKPGGTLVVAAAKEDGGDSARKRWAALIDIDGHLSKHHGVAFWARRPAVLPDLATANEIMVEGRYATAPGMFSHGEVDPASRLLADSLPKDLKGAVADFGAGWGYLAARLAERFERVTKLHLYEADFAACAAARRNLDAVRGERATEVVWADVTAEQPLARYDTIVMNPPFHAQARTADPKLGTAMIAAAARALKPGGRLFVVANRQLPYEAMLRASFGQVSEMPGDGRFKLFVAKR
jgi:16S rRNA (guanine1207-N2)-methyltransferase